MKISPKLRWIDDETAELHSKDFKTHEEFKKELDKITDEIGKQDFHLAESIDLGDDEKIVFKK